MNMMKHPICSCMSPRYLHAWDQSNFSFTCHKFIRHWHWKVEKSCSNLCRNMQKNQHYLPINSSGYLKWRQSRKLIHRTKPKELLKSRLTFRSLAKGAQRWLTWRFEIWMLPRRHSLEWKTTFSKALRQFQANCFRKCLQTSKETLFKKNWRRYQWHQKSICRQIRDTRFLP